MEKHGFYSGRCQGYHEHLKPWHNGIQQADSNFDKPSDFVQLSFLVAVLAD